MVYRGLKFKCKASEEADGTCYYRTGEDVLRQRSINNTDVTFSFIMLIVLNLAYRLVAMIGVWVMYRGISPWKVVRKTFGYSIK